jgi:hypothetical protein
MVSDATFCVLWIKVRKEIGERMDDLLTITPPVPSKGRLGEFVMAIHTRIFQFIE